MNEILDDTIFIRRSNMEEKLWLKKMERVVTPNQSFIDFLNICIGDQRLKNSFDFANSIKAKVNIVGVCLNELFYQLQPYEEEVKELKSKGYVEGNQHLILVVKYETFLNSIYGLMENIAQIVSKIYYKESLPRMFHDQKDRLLKNPTIDQAYSNLLEQVEWYDEVRLMRSEFTHFLTGIIVSYGEDIPGYQNTPKSTRKDALDKIEIKDIREHAQEIYNKLMEFLQGFGEHFLQIINKDVRIAEVCGITQNFLIGTKLISYDEKINGKPGICNTYKLDCPDATKCEARKNTDLVSGKEKDSI